MFKKVKSDIKKPIQYKLQVSGYNFVRDKIEIFFSDKGFKKVLTPKTDKQY